MSYSIGRWGQYNVFKSYRPPALIHAEFSTQLNFSNQTEASGLEGWICIDQQLLEVGLSRGYNQRSFLEENQKLTWNHVPASGAGCKESLYPQCASYRAALVSDVPSLSPPGLTQTKASRSGSPVLVEKRSPNPVPITLHQSPQAFCLVGWTPFRADGTISLMCLSRERGW